MNILLLLLFVVAIFFFFLEGKRDGSFYHANMKTPDPVKENIHWVFFATRTIVMGLMGGICLYNYSFWVTALFLLSLALVFSFVHNGVYYATRHQLDNNIYPKGFWDDSTTSTATMEIDVKMRTIMAVIGVIGVVTSIIIS